MENEFVSYEVALELKKLGFDGECLGSFSNCIVNSRKSIKKLYIDVNSILDKNQFIKNSVNANILCSAPLYQQAFDFLLSTQAKNRTECEIKNGEFISITLFYDGSGVINLSYTDFISFYSKEEGIEKLIEIIKTNK